MVQHIMIATQMTNPFATLPRRINAVSDTSRFKAHAAIIVRAKPSRYCAKHRSEISFNSAPMPCDSYRGCNSEPSAVIKSP
jgi:hypothetical protein